MFRSKMISRFCELSTIHGLNLINRGHNRVHSVFWTLVFVGAVSALLYNIYTLVRLFVEAPQSINMEVFANESLLLPNITVCVLRRFNKTKLRETFDTDDDRLVAYFDSVFFTVYTQSWTDDAMEAMVFASNDTLLTSLAQVKKSIFFAHLESITLSCEGMFDKVYMNSHPFPRFCDLWAPFLAQNGPCFALRQELYQSTPGAVGSASIAYVHPFPHVTTVPLINSFLESSIQVFLGPERALTQQDPISVAIGSYTHVVLEARLEALKQGDEQFPCHPNNAPSGLRYSPKYTPQNCMYECAMAKFIDRCRCVPFTTALPTPNGSIDNFCDPHEAYQCSQKIDNEMAVQLSECRMKRCYQLCDDWVYTLTTSAAPIDQKDFPTGLLELPRELDEMQKQWGGLTMIDVYYGSISYTKMEVVETMTTDLLIASMGGAFGWWSGASVISLMHLLEFLIHGIYRFFRPIKRVTKTTTTSADGDKSSSSADRASQKDEITVVAGSHADF